MLVNIQDYKCKKLEQEYFKFYQHIEPFFEEKADERSIIQRTYFAIRYLQDLGIVLNKYLKTKEATPHIRKIAKAEASWLKEIAEVLDA